MASFISEGVRPESTSSRNRSLGREASARDAVGRFANQLAPLEPDAAAVDRVMAAHQVDESRFAGAVRPDQAEDLAAAHLELDMGERLDALERLRQIAHHED